MEDWREPPAASSEGKRAASASPADRPPGGENWTGDLETMIQFAQEGIVSKTVLDRPGLVNISLFMMATGQTMSSHAAGRPATIQVLGGEGIVTIGEQTYESGRGSFFYMPAGQSHALESTDDMVFLLYLLG